MTDIIDIKMISSFAPDIILVLLCALACLYCFLLHRRLNRLNNLKTGVGASIVSLTKAVEKIYVAAQDAQGTTRTMIQSLDQMIMQAESTLTKLEAEKIAVNAQVARTSAVTKTAHHLSAEVLPEQIRAAKATNQTLLNSISSLDTFKKNLQNRMEARQEYTAPSTVKIAAGRNIDKVPKFFNDDYEAEFQTALEKEATRRANKERALTKQMTAQKAMQLNNKIRDKMDQKIRELAAIKDISPSTPMRKISFGKRASQPFKVAIGTVR